MVAGDTFFTAWVCAGICNCAVIFMDTVITIDFVIAYQSIPFIAPVSSASWSFRRSS